jgi:uroporphyrinogen decarboxylase
MDGGGNVNLYDRVLGLNRRMVAPMVGYPGIRWTGKRVKDALCDPRIHGEVLERVYDYLDPDMLFTLLDLTVEAEALGMPVEFQERRPPRLVKRGGLDLELLAEREIPDPEESGRMPLFLEAAEQAASFGDCLVAGYVTGPLTLLVQLAGMTSISRALRECVDMEEVGEALRFATRVVGEYAAALSSRLDVVVVVDPAVEALRPSVFHRVYLPFVRGLSGIIHGSGAACLFHVCGDITPLTLEFSACGVDGLILDPRTDIIRAAEEAPSSFLILGNLDPVGILRRGTPDDVRLEVRRLLRKMRGFRSFVLSTGCDVPLDVPLENLEAMVEEGRNWKPAYALP